MKRLEFMTATSGFAGGNGMRGVRAGRIDAAAGIVQERSCWVIEEKILRLDVAEVGTYDLLWSEMEERGATRGFTTAEGVLSDISEPEVLALCLGFMFTQSLIQRIEDVDTMTLSPESPGMVQVRLANRPSAPGPQQDRCVGIQCIGNVPDPKQRVPDKVCLGAADLLAYMSDMENHQGAFRIAGGAHAAAVFTVPGGTIAIAEDLGRHNALDKVIGMCLLRGRSTAGCGVLLSSRINLQLVAKAARAGFEIVAAASAPSSLAIEAAQRAGITLCGFVRGGQLSAFTYPHRLSLRPTEG
jgi:FdhD protein